jgi:hypothetical protein
LLTEAGIAYSNRFSTAFKRVVIGFGAISMITAAVTFPSSIP